MLLTIVRTGSILHSLNIGRAFTCHTEKRETEIEEREPAVRALLAVRKLGDGKPFSTKEKSVGFLFLMFELMLT